MTDVRRPQWPVLLTAAIAVVLLLNPALNWLAVRAIRAGALAAQPGEVMFVGIYANAATELVAVWAVLNLTVGVALVVLAVLARPDRRVAGWLLMAALGGTAIWAGCGMTVNTGSALWTGPDEWDVVAGSVPAWLGPALITVAGAVVALCVLAISVVWRRMTPRPAPPVPADPTPADPATPDGPPDAERSPA
jgi:hypothetical protein